MMSYSRSNTGIKFNSSMGSIARLSALRKSFLSPVSEAVSAASAKSASVSYLTPTEQAYLRSSAIRAPTSSSSSSGSVSASLSTSLSSNNSKSRYNLLIIFFLQNLVYVYIYKRVSKTVFNGS